jgi:glycosyltransferase involved in cell wall biosynthesis
LSVKHVRTSVLWTTEDPYELDRNVQLASMFDIVFTNDVNALPFYPTNTKHLPFAASDKFHDVPVLREPGDFLFDLFFVGTAWPERVGAINSLLSRLKPNLRKKIGLSGNPHLPNFHLGDLDLITNFRLAPREFARMANRSIVSLTLDRSFSNQGITKIQGGTPPPRLFELALAGTAQIYVTQRATMAQYFVPGEEILIVDCMDAAAEAIQALMENPDRREKIALAARERALRDHLYSNRIADIIETGTVRNRSRLAGARAAVNKRKRILIVSHNVAGIPPFGGVELYQETQAEVLSAHDFSILYPDRNTGRLHLKDMKDGTSISFNSGLIQTTKISDPRREEILGDVIQRYNFDLVHYHHLIGHPLALPFISYAFGVPSVFQMHDYYSLCHEFTLIGYQNKYCNIQDSRVEVCDICLSTRGVAPPGAQTQRRRLMTSVLGRIDAFVHNSEYTKRKFAQIYPELDMNLHHVIGNTARRRTLEDLFEFAGKADRRNRQSERLQVAILGNFTHPKGGDFLIAMFWQMAHDPIDIHIIGRVDSNLASVLLNAAFVNVKVHGEFDQSNLALKLRDMDVSVHFSIWPETYCISLDEARAAGLVPIVLGYGALAERVRNGIDGIVIDRERPFDLIKVLRKYCIDRGQLETLRFDHRKLKQGHDNHFDALDDIYHDLFSRYPVSGPPNIGIKSRPLLLSDLSQRFNNKEWTHVRVDYDENPIWEDLMAIEIENRVTVTSPREVTAVTTVEPGLRPGDDSISLVVDEVVNSIASEMIVFIPQFKASLAFGIGVPIGLDRLPFEIRLIGERSYRVALGTTRHLVAGSSWSACRLDMKNIEPGLYSLVIGLRASDRILRYGSGTRLSVRPRDKPVWRGENAFYSKPWIADSLEAARNSELGPAGRARRLSRKIKAELRALASGGKRDGIIAHIDSIGGIKGERRRATRVPRNEGTVMKIVGWAVPRGSDEPFDAIVVRLIGEDGVVAAPAVLVQRPDVSRHFRKNKFVRSGIEWTCPMESLAFGSYKLDIIGVDAGGRMHGVLARELIIE